MGKPIFTPLQIGIGKILRDYRLKVPPHQRDYSWRHDKEVITLFEDLADAIADTNNQAYFLGTIVTIEDDSGQIEIIDGQQRLATITLLLCNIKRYLMSLGTEPVIVKDLEDFLVYTDRTERATYNRLRMNLIDNEFFSMILDDRLINTSLNPKRRSNKLIKKAFDIANGYVKKIVNPFNPKAHGDVLNRWINYIENDAEVILLQVPSAANAYRMFETLNDRGLRTTQADLIKNYLFGHSGTRFDEVQDLWSTMRGALESLQKEDKEDITVNYLRQAIMVIQGFVRREKLYEAIQDVKGAQATVAFLDKIKNLANIYVATYFQDHEYWKKYPDAMLSAIETINFFDIAPFRPTLISAALKFIPKEALKAFSMFVSLGVRLLIAGSTRTGSVEETLAAAANKIYLGAISTAAQLKNEISGIIPTDVQFREAFETATVSKAFLARYYLRTLENVVQAQEDPHFIVKSDEEEITLEHILPEKPEKNWPQFTSEEHASYWKRIGNMILLRYKINSDLKSEPFQVKVPEYKKCSYKLTEQVTTLQDWTIETIRKRQVGLAKSALKAWPI